MSKFFRANLILLLIPILLAGCGQKPAPQLSQTAENLNQAAAPEAELPVPDANWVARRQAVDQNFNLNNYQLLKKSGFELGPKREYQKNLNDLEMRFYAFSPDQSRYLDVYGQIDVYEQNGQLGYEASTVEMGPNIPSDFPDPNFRAPAIVNIAKDTAQTISGVEYISIRNSFWISDQEFGLTGVRVVDGGLIPYINYFNLHSMESSYYEGPLERTCERLGNCPEDMMMLKVYITGCPSRITREYERQVPKTTGVAKAALTQLFYGPFAGETEPGQQYLFSEPNDATIKDIKIIDNIAYVNLDDIRNLFVYDGAYAGPDNATLRNCQEYAFFEQMTKTLRQFSNIKDAIYFIEGDDFLFYDFLGIKCPGDLCYKNPFQPSMVKTRIFANQCYDPVRSFIRLIPPDSDLIKATVTELFKGLQRYETQPSNPYYMFNSWTADILKDLVIKDQLAYVNLADFRSMVKYPDYKCNAPQFFASVGATLNQFPEIKDAIYFINGDTDTFYNYMGIKCPYEKECQYNPFK